GRLAGRLTDGGKNEENMFGFHNMLRTTGTFLNGDLTVNANASFKREQWKYHRDQRRFNIGYGPDDVRAEGGDGAVIERNGDLSDIILDLYGRYEKTWGDHNFGIL